MNETKNLELLLTKTALLIVLGLSAAARGRIIYVDGAATGASNGSNWANAHRCLQDALANARPGDEIRVAKGVYRPDRRTEFAVRETQVTASGDRAATFQLVDGVTIVGGYAGGGASDPDMRDVGLYETVLSGDLNADDAEVSDLDELLNELTRADNSYQIVTGSGTGETAVLDGFTIAGGSASPYTNRDGGGLVNEYGSPQIINCTFISNSARSYGAAIYNYYSSPTIVDCAFIANASRGGCVYNYQSHPNLLDCEFTGNSDEAMFNVKSNPILTGCTFRENADSAILCNASAPNLTGCVFVRNSGGRNGGALYCRSGNPILTECTFIENSADYSGGAVYVTGGDPVLNNCTFIENSAGYGGAIHNADGSPVLNNCALTGNSARDYGGAIYNTGDLVTLNNCLLNANSAYNYGGAAYCSDCDMTVTNCTLVGNSARNGGTLAFNSRNQTGGSDVSLINCIVANSADAVWIFDRSTVSISHSNIEGGWPGEGNIDADPLFVDPEGPDGVAGTQDDNFQLAPLSLCVDAGLEDYEPGPDETDIEGGKRIVGGRVDMGAYEFQGLTYVDDASESPLADGTESRPFGNIQQAIDIAKDGYTVLVKPGVYGKIDFRGKAITVAGCDGAPTIEEPWNGRAGDPQPDAVTFHTGEGPDSVLRNFVIRGAGMAISLNYGSSPTIQNLTIVDNSFGIAAYENSNPDITNCIFWNNTDGDLFQCTARFSCLEDGAAGEGNISVNPLFVDDAGSHEPDSEPDYHLKSEGHRWDRDAGIWTYDHVTSPCIDAGDPATPLGDEPMSVPRDPDNRFGLNSRINMGAYGGTSEASMPPLGWALPEDHASDGGSDGP